MVLRRPLPIQHPTPLPPWLAFTAATLLYLLVATLAPPYPSGGPVSHLFQPAGGVALALLLWGGRRLAASVLLGAWLAQVLCPDSSAAMALSQALASTSAAVLGAALVQQLRPQHLRSHRCSDHWQWLAYAGAVAAALGALVHASALWLLGDIAGDAWVSTGLHWWLGNALGTVLVSTLLLACCRHLQTPKKLPHLAEGWLLYGLSLAAGQVIFLNGQQTWLAPVASGYWMFLFVTWAGVRLGMLGTVGLLCLVTLQALAGTLHGSGFFAADLLASHGFGYWSYSVILSLVGLSLAAYVAEQERQNAQQAQQHAQHQARENAHRDALVREVHHRIKNNLQGLIGMMQRFEQEHPQLHDPLTQLMGQAQSIAVIHGLQGGAHIDEVRLCELLRAMVAGQEALWQTPVALTIAPDLHFCRLQPSEAVPVALILNELILNAIKHGGQEHQDVQVVLRQGLDVDGAAPTVHISISNPHCHCTPPPGTLAACTAAHMGLDLVAALMPRHGATLQRQQEAQRTTVELTLQPPTIQTDNSATL